MKLSEKYIGAFQRKILSWYKAYKRDLPWRRIPDSIPLSEKAYRVLISEVMLQQTQVGRVIPKYNEWLTEFPTVEILAKAPTAVILRIWSGLGYNRRALYLQKAAQIIVQQYGGKWPETIGDLKKLPGIGEYTARAIACFAFGKQVAVVDTNVRKVIILKVVDGEKETKETEGNKRISDIEIQQIADQLLPAGKAYAWNQALMDYAAAVLSKEKIPIPKQSRFPGSRRYYRGKLLKLLHERKVISAARIGPALKDNYTDADQPMIKSILSDMEKEGFLKCSGDAVSIAE